MFLRCPRLRLQVVGLIARKTQGRERNPVPRQKRIENMRTGKKYGTIVPIFYIRKAHDYCFRIERNIVDRIQTALPINGFEPETIFLNSRRRRAASGGGRILLNSSCGIPDLGIFEFVE